MHTTVPNASLSDIGGHNSLSVDGTAHPLLPHELSAIDVDVGEVGVGGVSLVEHHRLVECIYDGDVLRRVKYMYPPPCFTARKRKRDEGRKDGWIPSKMRLPVVIGPPSE